MKRLFLIFVLFLLIGCSAETPIDTADTAADTTETDTAATDAAETDTADTTADTTETDTTAADTAQTDTDATADAAADTTETEENETEDPDVKQVQIIALKFIPKDMIIKVGTTVRWFANDERGPHKLKVWYENVGVEVSPRLEKASGDTWEYTFEKAGEWRVTDSIFKTVSGLDAHITVTDDSAENTTVEE